MNERDWGVTCGNRGRTLDEPPDLPISARPRCPVSGSTTRGIYGSESPAAAASIRVSISDAVAVSDAPKAHVKNEGVPADHSPQAEQIRRRYRATLDWLRLETLDRREGAFWLLQVLNEHGELVEGGVGDNPEEAFDVYERLAPPA